MQTLFLPLRRFGTREQHRARLSTASNVTFTPPVQAVWFEWSLTVRVSKHLGCFANVSKESHLLTCCSISVIVAHSSVGSNPASRQVYGIDLTYYSFTPEPTEATSAAFPHKHRQNESVPNQEEEQG